MDLGSAPRPALIVTVMQAKTSHTSDFVMTCKGMLHTAQNSATTDLRTNFDTEDLFQQKLSGKFESVN